MKIFWLIDTQKIQVGLVILWKSMVRLFRLYGKQLLVGIFLLLLYFVLQPFLHDRLSKYWVSPVMEPFVPGTWFDIGFLIVGALLIYTWRRRPFSARDWFMIGIYLYVRFVNHEWVFQPIFSSEYGKPFSFWHIDIIAVYYLYRLTLTILDHRRKKELEKNPVTEEPDVLHTDLPLELQSRKLGSTLESLDAEGLNRNKFADEIAKVLVRIRPYQAFAMGVSGVWGSGKTSLISLIIKRLQQRTNLETNPKGKEYVYIHFVPWFFSGSEMLITSFFAKIEAAFGDDFSLAADIKTYGRLIAAMEKTLFKTEFSPLIFLQSRDLEKRYERISARIREKSKILIISIDDLDRLDKKEVVDVFRLIRLVANFPSTIYIVGYDRSYVNSAIKEQLITHDHDKYVDKVFNLEFRIPQTSSQIIRERLQKAIQAQIKSLYGTTTNIKPAQLAKAIKTPATDSIIRTERDILRFSNNLMIRHLSVQQDINFYQLFLLELISYHQPEFIDLLFLHKDAILKEHARIRQDHSHNGSVNINSIFTSPPPQPIADIISRLFNEDSAHEDFTIASPDYVNRYFSLSLLSGEYSEQEFQDAMQLPYPECGAKLKIFHGQNPRVLRDKLNAKYPNHTIEDENELDRLVRALLILYVEVYPSPKNDGLNRTDLALFIISVTRHSNRPVSFISARVNEMTLLDYSPFTYFFGAEFLQHEVNDLIQMEPDLLAADFAEAQLKILDKELSLVSNGYSERIADQIKELYEFVRLFPTQVSSKWYLDNVIKGHFDWFKYHFNGISDWVVRQATEDGELDSARIKNALRSLLLDINDAFYDTEEWHKYHLLDRGYLMINYEQYHLRYTLAGEIPLRNDQYGEKILELKDKQALRVTLRAEQKFWRFGFRLSKVNYFSNDARYAPDYAMVQLSKGIIEPENDAADRETEGIELSVNHNNHTDNLGRFLKDSGDETIYVTIAKSHDRLSIYFEDKQAVILEHKKLEGYRQFNFVQITAWADKRPLNISAGIEILQRPDVPKDLQIHHAHL